VGIATPALSLPALLASAFLVSFATVAIPGPITIVASRLALHRLPAAVWFLAGVTVLDVALFLALAAGAGPLVAGLGGLPIFEILGGLVLLWVGIASLRHAPPSRHRQSSVPGEGYSAPTYFLLGVAVAGGNPHYWFWWLSAGLALIQAARSFGADGLVWLLVALVAGVVGWYIPLLVAVRRGRTLLSSRLEAFLFKLLSLATILVGGGLITLGVSHL